jgi:hypothetical protein
LRGDWSESGRNSDYVRLTLFVLLPKRLTNTYGDTKTYGHTNTYGDTKTYGHTNAYGDTKTYGHTNANTDANADSNSLTR